MTDSIQENKLFMVFRIISFLEGLSWIFLLVVAMPMKYMMDAPELVKLTGPIHGGLFTFYCILAIWVKSDLKWSNKTTAFTLALSLIPFGMVYAELKIFRSK